jgi:hypothetical protein
MLTFTHNGHNVKIFKIVWVVVMISLPAVAASLLDDMTQTTSIRSMGLGNAGVAFALGGDALLSNPAGLANGGGGVYFYNFDTSSANYDQHKATLYHRKSFGVGSVQTKIANESLNMFVVGVAKSNVSGPTWGINYKSVRYASSTLWTGDFGVRLPVNRTLTLGGLVQHAMGSKGKPSPVVQLGGVFGMPRFGIQCVADVVFDPSNKQRTSPWVRYGLDAPFGPDITLRAGGNPTQYSLGASLTLGPFALDYAYQWDKITPSNAQYALGARFGRML